MGLRSLWTALLTLPLMYGIQEMCGRIGLVTKNGLMRLIKDLEEIAVAETMPRQEGNQMHTILTGKKGAPKAAAPKAKAEETTNG